MKFGWCCICPTKKNIQKQGYGVLSDPGVLAIAKVALVDNAKTFRFFGDSIFGVKTLCS